MNKEFKTNKSVYYRLIIYAILVLIALNGAILFSVYQQRNLILESVTHANANLGETMSQFVQYSLHSADLILRAITREIEIENLSENLGSADVLNILLDYLHETPFTENIVVLNTDGYFVNDAGELRNPDSNFSFREYYTIQRDNIDIGTYIGEPVYSPVLDETIIAISRRINRPDGSFAGVVAITMLPRHLKSFLASLQQGEKGHIGILRDDGTVLAHIPDHDDVSSDNNVIRRCSDELRMETLIHPFSGRVEFGNELHLVAIQKTKGFPVFVVVSSEYHETLANWYQSSRREIILAIVATLLVLLMVWLFIRFLNKQRSANQALWESENRLKIFIEHAPVAVAMFDDNIRYIQCSMSWKQLFKLGDIEIIGASQYEVIPRISEACKAVHERCLAGAVEFSEAERVIKSDGTSLWLRWESRPWYQHDGSVGGLLMFAENITDRVNSRLSLEESNQKLELAIDSFNGGVWDLKYLVEEGLDGPTTIAYLSPRLKSFIGFNDDEFPNDISEWHKRILPEDRDRIYKIADEYKAGKFDKYDVEYRIYDKNNNIRWIHSCGVVHQLDEGKIIRWVGVDADITERKLAQEREQAFQEKLQQSQKLESLGVLAGGIAHDFNNIMTGIIGYTDLSMTLLPPDHPVKDNLKEIMQVSQRAADVVRQMIAYAGKGKMLVQPVVISSVVTEMLPLINTSIDKTQQLELDLSENLPAIEADILQIKQVLMNLVLNSTEAIGSNPGVINICTRVVYCDVDFFQSAVTHEALPVGNYVSLEIRDTGCGMSPDLISKMFDPFFSTKFAGRGLGMPAVLGILRSHNGAIKVVSEPGKGTTVCVFFPEIRPGAAPKQIFVERPEPTVETVTIK